MSQRRWLIECAEPFPTTTLTWSSAGRGIQFFDDPVSALRGVKASWWMTAGCVGHTRPRD